MKRFSFTDRQNAAKAATNNDRPGELIVKPGKAYVYTPGYDMGPQKDGITVFRLLPHVDPATGQFVPFYEGEDFGDWIRVYTTIRYFGNDPDNQASFIVDDGMNSAAATQHPTAVLRKAVKRALDAGTDPGGWSPYINGQKPFISEAKALYFVQVVLLHHNKAMDGPKGLTGKPYILMLSPSAGEALCDLVRTPISEATLAQRAQSQDPIQLSFEHGDPVSITDGRWIVMYKRGNGDPRTRHLNPTVQAQPQLFGQQALPQTSQDKKALAEANSYACYTEHAFYNIPANFLADPVQTQALASTTQPWDELLYFPTVEEQVALIATRMPFNMLEYAFQNHPSWLQIVRNKLGMDTVHMGYGSTAGPTLPPTTAPTAFASVPAGPAAGTAFGGAPVAPMFGVGVAPGVPNVNPTTPSFNGVPPVAQASFGTPAAVASFGTPVAAPTTFGGVPGAPVAPVAPAAPVAPVAASVSPMANASVFGAVQAPASATPVTPPAPAVVPMPPSDGSPVAFAPPANPVAGMMAHLAPQVPAGATPLAANAFAVLQQAAAAQTGVPAAPTSPAASHPGASVFGGMGDDPADGAPF